MPEFLWRARNSAGTAQSGRMEAGERLQVARRLMERGLTPISIEPMLERPPEVRDWRHWLGWDRPSLDELALFCRQMYTLTRAGVPLIQGLGSLAAATHNSLLKQGIEQIAEALGEGSTLAEGMMRSRNVFPPMLISVVRVGESSGNLQESFNQIAHHLEQERDFRRRVGSALRYPFLVVAAMLASLTVILTWVIPTFADFFTRQGVSLPLPTRIIIGASDLMITLWWLLALLLAAGWMGFRYWVGTRDGHLAWDHTKLRIPLFGDILFRSTMARFARAFGMTIRSGVPLIQGLTLVSQSLENEYIGSKVKRMCEGIERGDSLSRTAQSTELFSPLLLQMINVGEETGDVAAMLEETADHYEREVDHELKNLSSLIEPILLLFLGMVVLVLTLGVFLPMWDLGRVTL
ncbi:type II secretion system F family protein [Ectothiorhodospira shaposhnikovii]|uniref:type II secretion system F family protein n=1 Tax=Ectothiorhodospira shaposhnikovii TaxID=1054 RepID=UPI001EE8672A|nr:type II secretion system F family protein [Ectothiorhodospira shaposhnikovii]MCG5514376.1 type II secretion system F family protein [Ectothiorhodospira shaposhnikovii]